MKKLIYVGLFFSLLTFNSCEKENIILPNQTATQQQSKVETIIKQGDRACSCGGFVLTKDPITGDFSCPGGSGCSKIMPCPCLVVASAGNNNGIGNDLFVESHYHLYKKALTENKLPHFFSTNKWVYIFPVLRKETAILNQLRNGQLTMVEVQTSTGSLMQLCVTHGKNESNINPSDVLFALEIPVDALSQK